MAQAALKPNAPAAPQDQAHLTLRTEDEAPPSASDSAKPMRCSSLLTRALPGRVLVQWWQNQRSPADRWDDTPLQMKISLLVVIALVGGIGVGMVEMSMGHRLWPMLISAGALAATLLWLGQRWVWRPFDQLLDQLNRLRINHRTDYLGSLPLNRRDEIGQLARAMHQIHVAAKRDANEARRLRRTLDDRVAKATHAATLRLRQLAMRDAMTDLGNRRFLEEHLPLLIESVQQSDHDVAAVMMDMDNFKQVNDTMGHAAGDELLIFLGSLINASVRRSDYAVRLGGDEFVIIMPGAELERVKQVTDQLRTLFRQQARTALPESIKADLSIGVAMLKRDDLSTGEQLLAKADEAVYQAKGLGKGCTCGV